MVGSALGHKCTTYTVKPYCGTFGYSYKVCDVCNQLIGVDAKGNEKAVASTTKKNGKYHASDFEPLVYSTISWTKEAAPVAKKIAVGATPEPVNSAVGPYTVAFDIDASLIESKHEWSGNYKVVKEPTFLETGCEAHTCKNCGIAAPDLHEIPKLTLGKAYQPKLTAGKGKLTVKITSKNKYATGYQIVYKVTGKNNAKYVKTTALTKTFKGLKKGKYEVKVRPYRVEGGQTFWGKYSTVKYVKVK